jgi:hypothetical protein
MPKRSTARAPAAAAPAAVARPLRILFLASRTTASASARSSR